MEGKKFQLGGMEITVESPLMLLRLIRNCYQHAKATDPTDEMFLNCPYFLDTFPELVVRLWEVCLRSPELTQISTLKPLLYAMASPLLTPPSTSANLKWF